MSNMNLRREKNENPPVINFSRFTLALVRLTPRPSSQSLSYYLTLTSHTLHPKNLALHPKRTTPDNFLGTPFATCLPKNLLPTPQRTCSRWLRPSLSPNKTMTTLLGPSSTFGLESPREGLIPSPLLCPSCALADEAITYDIANSLGGELTEKRKFEEVKVFVLPSLEGRRSVLGSEQKQTLGSLNNMEVLHGTIKEYEKELDYYQQALSVKQEVLGKTRPSTLKTIMIMATAYKDRLKDFTKAEGMYRLSLDGHEKWLGKTYEDTKRSVKNLGFLVGERLKDKEETRELAKRYPFLLNDTETKFVPNLLRGPCKSGGWSHPGLSSSLFL